MHKPKISVVIPVYNVELYLPECLESIINQSFKDIEIICIDNNSQDGSIEILKQYQQKDSRIKIIDHKTGKLGGARNRGIRESIGTYITFIDSDDFISQNYLAILYKYSQQEDIDIVIHSNILFVYEDHQDYLVVKRNNKKNFPYKDIAITEYKKKIELCCDYYPWNKLFKSSFLRDNYLYFIEDRQIEDATHTSLSLLYSHKVYFIPYHIDIAYFYRQRQNSTMNNKRTLKILDGHQCLLEVFTNPFHKQKIFQVPMEEKTLFYLYLYFSLYGTMKYYFGNNKKTFFNFKSIALYIQYLQVEKYYINNIKPNFNQIVSSTDILDYPQLYKKLNQFYYLNRFKFLNFFIKILIIIKYEPFKFHPKKSLSRRTYDELFLSDQDTFI